MDAQRKSRSQSSGAITCLKLLLHLYNILYMIIGVCVLAIGIWTQTQLRQYMELSGLYYTNTAYVMVGVGVVILLVAVAGFYCTAKDKIALLYLYATFITLLAIIQIALGIAGAAYSKSLNSSFLTGLTNSLSNPHRDMDAWNKVQQTLGCCGVSKPTDWIDIANTTIPGSCYDGGVTPPTIPTTTPDTVTTTTDTVITTTDTVTTTTDTVTTTTAVEPTTTTVGPKTTTVKPITTTVKPAITTSTDPNTTAANETATIPTTAIVSSVGRKKRAVPSQSITSTAQPQNDLPYDKGCHDKIVDSVSNYLGVIIGVCIGFVLLQICGALLACCLAKKTSKNNYEQIY